MCSMGDSVKFDLGDFYKLVKRKLNKWTHIHFYGILISNKNMEDRDIHD